MILSEFGIRRPTTVLMIFIGVTVIGLVSLLNLNIDLFPDMTYPIVAIMTDYPGVGPSEVESMVTKPFESVVSMVRNVKNVHSVSKEGASLVMVELDWGTDVDAAAIDVREKLDLVKDHLPSGVQNPVIVKFDPALMPIMVVGISSPRSLPELRQYADDNIKDRLARIPGVAAVAVEGGQEREIQARIDRSRMEAVSISLDQVRMALAASNLNLPGGHLKVGSVDYLIRIPGEFRTVAEVGATVVGNKGGVPIRLSDIAEVADSYSEFESETRLNGQRSTVLVLQKQSGSNTVQVSDRIRRKLDEISRELPSDIKFSMGFDSADFIRRSIRTLQFEAVFGALLALIIIVLFLRNLSSTLIISIAIPFSVVATFIMMYFKSMTLNIITLGGLALGIGRLVDDSIVVLENIYRHREQGQDPVRASLEGSNQVSMAVLAATVTTIVVFLPVAYVSGIAGVLFRPMAYTVSFALIGSYFVSMMLLPLMTSRFLRMECRQQECRTWGRRLLARVGEFIDRLDGVYTGVITRALKKKRQVMLATGAVILATLALVWPLKLVDTEFIPQSDEGYFEVQMTMPVGTPFERTGGVVRRIEDMVKAEVPEAVNVYTVYGEGEGMRKAMGSTGANYGEIGVRLTPRSERRRSVDQIVESLRPKIERIPDAKVVYQTGGLLAMMLTFGSTGGVAVDIQGHDLETSKRLAEEVRAMMEAVKGAKDVTISRKEGLRELRVVVDRDKAGALGLSIYQIAGAVETAFKGTAATRFRDPKFGKEYDVVVKLRERDRLSFEDLARFSVMSPLGQPVALSNVARLEKASGPVDIQRKNRQRIVTVSCGVTGRAIGSVNAELEAKIREMRVPEGFTVEVSGSAREMAESFKSLFYATLLAVLLVYMVLASQFESLLDPFVIMFSVPLGLVGVVWGLFLTGVNFSVIAFIGVIMLVGIVVSNAILLVDYANVLRRRGMELYQAVAEAGRVRLRPILMTSLTTMVGMLPMALGIGESSETYSPLAIAVISGLLVSTILTLVFVPTLYIIFEERLKRELKVQHPMRRSTDPHPRRRVTDQEGNRGRMEIIGDKKP
jgi:HAE1 family hydrophobic/amphiphilic exporter-1